MSRGVGLSSFVIVAKILSGHAPILGEFHVVGKAKAMKRHSSCTGSIFESWVDLRGVASHQP